MENTDLTKLPEADAKDIITKLFIAGVKAVPLGGTLSELMSIVIVPSLDKRRKEWLENIAIGLIKLQKQFHNFEFENLHENNNFTTAFMHASASALKNHQKEKLEALRNAVLNTTTANAPSEDLQLIFINYIDTITKWHIRILKFYHDPQSMISDATHVHHTNSVENVILGTFEELKGKDSFYKKIISDLGSEGLINHMSVQSGAIVLLESQTTSLGKQFIEFITSPL